MDELRVQARISIIVPMYNAAEYLRRCLDSIKAQVFKEFEAVLVNDGSTDLTAAIAREYAEGDCRFRLVDKENGGVASARNTGLAASTGDYIAFVDSDDFVEPDYLYKLYASAVSQNADVVCCNFNRYFPKSGLSLPHLLTKQPAIYSSEPLLKGLLHDTAFQSYLWNRLWRRSLFTENGIVFPKRYFEDTQVSFRLFYHARRVVILPDVLYNYTQRGDSIVHTLNPESENDFLEAFASIRSFLEQRGEFGRYRSHFRYYTVKSFLFVWGVVFLIHFRERNFGGLLGNLKRPVGFLAYYGGRRFRLAEEGPESSGTIRKPGVPSRRSKALRSRDAA